MNPVPMTAMSMLISRLSGPKSFIPWLGPQGARASPSPRNRRTPRAPRRPCPRISRGREPVNVPDRRGRTDVLHAPGTVAEEAGGRADSAPVKVPRECEIRPLLCAAEVGFAVALVNLSDNLPLSEPSARSV